MSIITLPFPILSLAFFWGFLPLKEISAPRKPQSVVTPHLLHLIAPFLHEISTLWHRFLGQLTGKGLHIRHAWMWMVIIQNPHQYSKVCRDSNERFESCLNWYHNQPLQTNQPTPFKRLWQKSRPPQEWCVSWWCGKVSFCLVASED